MYVLHSVNEEKTNKHKGVCHHQSIVCFKEIAAIHIHNEYTKDMRNIENEK